MRGLIGSFLTAVVAGAVGAAVVAAPAVWGHGGRSDAVHACVAGGGGVTITADPTGFGDPSAGCADSKAHALDWAQTGTQGPAGPSGPAGPAGPAGSAGSPNAAAGPSVYVTHGEPVLLDLGESRTVAQMELPAGSYRIEASVTAAISRIDYAWWSGRMAATCSLAWGTRGLDATGISAFWEPIAVWNPNHRPVDPGWVRYPGNRWGSARLELLGIARRTTGAAIRLRCQVDGAGRTLGVDFLSPQIVATPIAGVVER